MYGGKQGWLVRSATLLLLAAAACDMVDAGEAVVKSLGCAAVATGHTIAKPIGDVIDALHWDALEDDSGEVAPGVLGDCANESCKPRIAQVGTTVDVHVDATKLANARDVSLDDTPSELVSSDDEVISVSHGTAKHGECVDEWNVHTNVHFEKEGTATLRVKHGADELADFTFEVAQAASVEVSASPVASTSDVKIEDAEHGTRSVRGGIQAVVSLQVRARAADGRVMLLDDSVRTTIDDTSVARFVEGDAGTLQGVQGKIIFVNEGSTTLRTEVGDVATTVELQADSSLPSPPPSAAGNGG